MHVALLWRCWGVPFGYSSSDGSNGWKWAVSIGPLHIIRIAHNSDETTNA